MSVLAKPRSAQAEVGANHEVWRGIHAVMVTPFQKDLTLDEQGLRANVEFLARSPVNAVLCLGSEGEFYALSDSERHRVAEVTAETLAGRRPLVIGVSHPSAVQAASFARHAASIGADAVLATPPFFGRYATAEVAAHFAAIADVGLPLFVYNTPSRVGYGVPAADMAEIARLRGVIGIKEASPDIAQLVDLIATLDSRDCLVLGGAESTIWPALAVGAAGNTATAASVVPAVFARLWELAQAGQSREGRDLYKILHPLRQAYGVAGGQAAVVKRLLDRAGLAGGPVRPPARPSAANVDGLLDGFVATVRSSDLWTA